MTENIQARAAAGVEADPYATDRAVVEADMTAAQSLPFEQYVAYMAHYGATLHELAAKHGTPEVAYRVLQDHADAVLERFGPDGEE